LKSIEFFPKQKGNYLYAQVEQLALDIEKLFYKLFSSDKIKITGVLLIRILTLLKNLIIPNMEYWLFKKEWLLQKKILTALAYTNLKIF
jgi:hypothetical protein